MNVKPSAALRAQSLLVAVLAFGLLLFPMIANSVVRIAENNETAALETKEDFLNYASINDVDIHELIFSTLLYEGTQSCIMCHESEALEMLDTGHFKWGGKIENIVGLEGEEHGKNDLINNFCIATATNEPRCTQCHVGLGYKDVTFDFEDPLNVDCLVCHDQSGTYKKGMKTAGMPDPSVDLNVVARSMSIGGGKPTRKACIGCHAKAGGGDNVKHGDLSTDLIATTREYDVHMGVDGADLVCADCHAANHDPKTGKVNHGIAGMSLHSVNEGEMKQCTDCHGSKEAIHSRVVTTSTDGTSDLSMDWISDHERLACQVCHIPAIARAISTKTEWYWSDAGQDVNPIPVDPESGRPTYDKKKGTFVWEYNVRPTLRYSNGKWNRPVLGVTDKYDEEPISLGAPVGDYNDPDAMIYPFKLMRGNQPVDPETHTISVPHLFGTVGGPNPYWGKFNWTDALIDGAAYTGQDFSGTYKFADTTMLLSVNHEVAPAKEALGQGVAGCLDCHTTDYIDWKALGWSGDPITGGERPSIVTIPDSSITTHVDRN